MSSVAPEFPKASIAANWISYAGFEISSIRIDKALASCGNLLSSLIAVSFASRFLVDFCLSALSAAVIQT